MAFLLYKVRKGNVGEWGLLILSVLMSFSVLVSSAGALNESMCGGESGHNKELYIEDATSPYLDVDGLYEFGQKLYNSPKRLPDYFIYDESLKSLVYRSKNKSDIKVPLSFVNKISEHLKRVLKMNLAKSINLSDLGHGHFLIPEEVAKELKDLNLGYEDSHEFVINHPKLKILYHAAERLQKLDDDFNPVTNLESRYFISVRNIIGDFSTGEVVTLPDDGTPYNTQRKIEGYTSYWTINFSWNKNACFKVETKQDSFFIDFTFSSYRSDPDSFVDESE